MGAGNSEEHDSQSDNDENENNNFAMDVGDS